MIRTAGLLTIALITLGFLGGCISAEKALEIDRSLVNQPQADLKSAIHMTESPLSGLRSQASGASSCSLCAK